MKQGNVIKEESYIFAIRIVKLYKFLSEEKKEYTLSKQVLKSGTSIGALIRESEHGESKLDFIHKLAIAIKWYEPQGRALDPNSGASPGEFNPKNSPPQSPSLTKRGGLRG